MWSAVEVVPTFAFGRAVAGATNAFLAGRPHLATGFAWLGLLLVAAAIGSVGSRNACIRLAAIVEPFRDDLVRRIVTGAVRRCVLRGAPPDSAATARISHQAEIIRDTFGGMLSALRRFVFVAASVLGGLATLLPMALVLAAGPLLAALVIFALLVGAFARKQRDYVLTEEAVAAEGSTVLTALRDITACGGEDAMYAVAARSVDAQVRASRGVARMADGRSLAISVGGWLPVTLVLAAAPWMLRQGASAGQIIGTLAYLAGGLQGALSTLVQGVGSSGIMMAVTLERIMELEVPPRAAERDTIGPAAARSGPAIRCRAARADVQLRAGGDTGHQQPEPVPPGRGSPGDRRAERSRQVHPCRADRPAQAGCRRGPARRRSAAPARPRRPGRPPHDHPAGGVVFAGTLGENLTYLNPGATPAALDQAADATGLRALAQRLGGDHARLDPASLSAGERQLIALARAYLSPGSARTARRGHLSPGSGGGRAGGARLRAAAGHADRDRAPDELRAAGPPDPGARR